MIYIFLLLHLYVGFNKISDFYSQNLAPKTKFSIIVPFRNEAAHLPNLIRCFENLNYPKDFFEIILVDDHSNDGFKIETFTIDIQVVTNIRQTNSPKKDAISTAIQIAKHNWIVTTDADCLVGGNWLKTLDQYIEKENKEMVVGAVKYEGNSSFLHQFQCLDMASLQGVTIGSFGMSNGFMCNGANFAYTKNLFINLNGFEGNSQIASGDDVFLLQKAVVNCPEKVGYLKSMEHTVSTKPVDSWKSLFFQRVRWASKTTAYNSFYPKFLGIIVLTTNILTIYLLFTLLFDYKILTLFLISVKFLVDTMIIVKTNQFLNSKTKFLFCGSLIYPFFSVAVAFYSLFGKYEWKGRTF